MKGRKLPDLDKFLADVRKIAHKRGIKFTITAWIPQPDLDYPKRPRAPRK